MSEFSTIVSEEFIYFVGSQICVKKHPIFKIIIAPKGIVEDVELLLEEISKNKNPFNIIGRIQKAAKKQQLGPFTIIRKKAVLTFGQQEAMRVPKLDYLIRHRLKSLLGLNSKIWYFDGENVELKPFQL